MLTVAPLGLPLLDLLHATRSHRAGPVPGVAAPVTRTAAQGEPFRASPAVLASGAAPSGITSLASGLPPDLARRPLTRAGDAALGMPRVQGLLGGLVPNRSPLPDDEVAETEPAPDPTPVPDPPAAWTPPTPLPDAGAAGRHVDIVLSPHPDDETLSLGVWIANATARGDRVIVVSLTDGRSTGAITKISNRLGRKVTRDEIATARQHEVQEAVTRLGVRPGDLYAAHLDDDHSPGGTRITQAEALDVIKAFAARFPSATFASMSWIAERHPDHLGAGLALHQAEQQGIVTGAVFAVSRLWWSLPSPAPAAHDVLPVNAGARRRVLLAASAYDRWDPVHRRLAVGSTSVHQQFTALLTDQRDRVHP